MQERSSLVRGKEGVAVRRDGDVLIDDFEVGTGRDIID
jgi:hypothetical protein